MSVRHVPVVMACTILLAPGCAPTAPSTPAAPEWRSQAALTLEAVAGELATARLVLAQHEHGRLFTPTAAVMLVEAEEASGKAVESFEALQPPAAIRSEDTDVSHDLTRAGDALRASRIALVEGGDGYQRLIDLLGVTRNALSARADDLRGE